MMGDLGIWVCGVVKWDVASGKYKQWSWSSDWAMYWCESVCKVLGVAESYDSGNRGWVLCVV